MTDLYILDTGAILSRKVNLLSGNVATTGSVLDEIKTGRLAGLIEEIRDSLEIRSPSRDAKAVAKEAAQKSGDLRFLSNTDIDVIALGYEVKGTVLSDDYSVLNVCSFMGIKAESVEKKGISKKLKWVYKCSGCGREVTTKICPICGHETKRYLSSSKE